MKINSIKKAACAVAAVVILACFISSMYTETAFADNDVGGDGDTRYHMETTALLVEFTEEWLDEGEAAMREVIDEAVALALDYGLTTVALSAAPQWRSLYDSELFTPAQGGTSLLTYFVNRVQSNGMQAVALLSAAPAEDSTSAGIADSELREALAAEIEILAQGYGLNGIYLDLSFSPGLHTDDSASYGGALDQMVRSASLAVGSTAMPLGVILPAYEVDSVYADLDGWLAEGLIQAVLPKLDMPIAAPLPDDFLDYADRWNTLASGWDTALIPIVSLGNSLEDDMEIGTELFYLENAGMSAMLSDYLTYRELSPAAMAAVDDFFDKYGEPMTSIQYGFQVTRPSTQINVESAYYYIMGISVPGAGLFCDSEEITDRGPQGSFGHYVYLEEGRNEFVISQPGIGHETVVINYSPPSITEPQAISNIVQSSMYPSVQDVAFAGEVYDLACTAPSGATVYATVFGETVELEQVAYAEDGIPASYSGSISVPGDAVAEGVVAEYGTVDYTLVFNGATSSYSSSGPLYVAGKNTDVLVTADSFMTNVYPEAQTSYDYYTTMNQGTADRVADQTRTMFELASGGFVMKTAVTVQTGQYNAVQSISGVRYATSYQYEVLTFEGINNTAFVVSPRKDGVTVSLYNTGGLSANDPIFSMVDRYSNLFEKVDVEVVNDTLHMNFSYKEGQSLWGCNVDDVNAGTQIYFKKRPVLSGSDDKPLEGITVLIDPGHGGVDPGALGPAGNYGPREKDVNLMVARQAQAYLEEMGAQVLMTHWEDRSVELYQRAAITDKVKPDIFVSVHSNSVVEYSNGGKADGVLSFYYNFFSDHLAYNLTVAVEEYTSRLRQSSTQSAYVVARPTAALATLLEIGYMCNPEQYEELINISYIERTGYAIAKGVQATLEGQTAPVEEDEE